MTISTASATAGAGLATVGSGSCGKYALIFFGMRTPATWDFPSSASVMLSLFSKGVSKPWMSGNRQSLPQPALVLRCRDDREIGLRPGHADIGQLGRLHVRRTDDEDDGGTVKAL